MREECSWGKRESGSMSEEGAAVRVDVIAKQIALTDKVKKKKKTPLLRALHS